MTQNEIGYWETYTAPASFYGDYTGVVALGYIPSAGSINVGSYLGTDYLTLSHKSHIFNLLNLTEVASSTPNGGIQTVDFGISRIPTIVPLPANATEDGGEAAPNIGMDLNFVEGHTVQINTILADGMHKRVAALEDLSTSKKLVAKEHTGDPYILLFGPRLYYVLITSFAPGFVGGYGNIISIRLSLQIVDGAVYDT